MQKVIKNQTQFDLSKYLNADGQIRWVIVNQEYLRGVITNEELIEIYRKWRNQNEYAVFCEFLPDFKLRYHAMKCSKRGNDVFNWRIKKKFRELDELGNLYGDRKIFNINLPNPKTHCLFLTLTYDTKLDDRNTAWKKVSTDYNRTVSRLRRKYGKISILRVWEASKKGYPHIHAILLFHDYKFNVFEHWSGHHSSYRIREKHEFADAWHSNVDVRAVDSIKGAIRYVSKYLRKVHQVDSEHDWTMANMWIHHKQSFALSGDFTQQIAKIRLDLQAMHNSNQKMIQLDLEGKPHVNQCVLVGFFTLEQIRQTNNLKRPNAWFFKFKNYPSETLLIPDAGTHKQLNHNQTALGSIVFSRSPENEQGKARRPIQFGMNFVPFTQNFYTLLTTSYHNATRNYKIKRMGF